jgi:hypothetical protein
LVGNAATVEDYEDLIEKKHMLAKQKDTFRQLTGKDYDKAPRGRFRGLRRVVAVARGLRKSGKEKPSPVQTTRDVPPPHLIRSMSDSIETYDTVSAAKDYKYTPRYLPHLWEQALTSSVGKRLINADSRNALTSIAIVLVCFIATVIVEYVVLPQLL